MPAVPNLLVLGTSDSDGSQLARRELAWPWLVAQSLETAGSAWALTHTRYYATAPGALGYLERQLGASAPDVVILSVTLYAYSMRTVANRIRHVAGKRAGDWAEARFRWFDARTGRGQAADATDRASRLNRSAHWFARRVLGTAPEASTREVWDAYRATVERLAREENARVIVIGSFPFTGAIERENAKARSFQLAFNARMRGLCRERRIGWVDPEFMRDSDVDALYSDALHFTAAAHQRVADAVHSALEDRG